jgi:hypothetical protein
MQNLFLIVQFLRKPALYIIGFLILHTGTTAQTLTIPVELKWQIPAEKTELKALVPEVTFEGAALYGSGAEAVPVYTYTTVFIGERVVNIQLNAKRTKALGVKIITLSSQLTEAFSVKYFTAWERKQQKLVIDVVPIRKSGNEIELLELFDVIVNYSGTMATGSLNFLGKTGYATQSVLANGDWYKYHVTNTGVHRITYKMLKDRGVPVDNIDPRTIKIYGNGPGMLPGRNSTARIDDLKENAIVVTGEGDGKFDDGDEILFYGKAQKDVWRFDTVGGYYFHETNVYTDVTAYMLTYGGNPGKRVQSISSLTPNRTSTEYDQLFVYERELVNLIKSGKRYMGEEFNRVLQQNFQVNMGPVNTSVPVYFRSSVAARSFVPSSFSVAVNGSAVLGHSIPQILANYETPFASSADGDKTAMLNVNSGNLSVTYTYNQPIPGSLGWLDFFEVQSRNFLNFSSGQLLIRDKNSRGAGNITRFQVNTSQQPLVWDVTDPTTPMQLTVTAISGGVEFIQRTDTIREFLMHTGNYITPQFVEKMANQNIHGMSAADYFIVTFEGFINEANRLANYHRTRNNLRVHVITVNQVYNEFASGVQDLTAIRDMMRMFYKRAATPADMPRYLMLFGRASYDYKNRISNNSNLVPTFESWESFDPVRTYCSDDYFGLLDDNEGRWDEPNDRIGFSGIKEFLDIGIGRLPAQTGAHATALVNKIIDYQGNPEWGDWMTKTVFVSDDEDTGLHQAQADILANWVRNNAKKYNVQKIHIDAYPEVTMPGGVRNPQAQDEIVRSVERGCLIFNYTGHGGEVGLASERVLNTDDINRWSNGGKLPIMVTATCEFSRYDDPERIAAGELAVLNPFGGAIALFTTVRLVNSGSNFQLNTYFYNRVGIDSASLMGPRRTIGDVMRLTKNDYIWLDKGERNFTLLGDPAMMLNYPELNVATTKINGQSVTAVFDTLKAYSKVTIEGRITDLNGNFLNTFNGVVYPTVYDKPAAYRTLNNNPASYPPNFTFNFVMQNNVIYRGKATVTNGEFSFTFIVPKDISYTPGFGRISYYAHNSTTDAIGYFDKVVVGATADTIRPDDQGPQIKLYLNDEKFVHGSITNENPLLIAKLFDMSGINITGRGIGRDIRMTLNNDNTQSRVLNDYFQAKVDTYQEGEVRFKMKDVEPGKYTLKFTAWDVYNNVGESNLDFIVAKDEEAAIRNLLNYPNPFTTFTTFHFDHNKPSQPLTVLIQIFTINGKLIKTLRTETSTTGNHFDQLTWDGRDEYGDPIGKGVYVYKAKVKSTDGKTAEEIQKLVILN